MGQSRAGGDAARGVPARAARLGRQVLPRLRYLRSGSGSGRARRAGPRGPAVGGCEVLREQIGVVSLTQWELQAYDYEGRVGAARNMLGDEGAWEEAFAQGRAMSAEVAVEYALSEKVTSAAPESPPADRRTGGPLTDLLTRREREVAALVARGLANRQIASELQLSERTIENHVSKILRRLGLASRAQVATWATEQRLLAKSNTD